MLRRRREKVFQAARLVRYLLEAVAAAAILSWFSARLPAAADAFSELRRVGGVLLHPATAFVAGNAIVAALVSLKKREVVKEREREVGVRVRRSKSEKMGREEMREKVLRRSRSENVRRREEDDERFRRKIEEFIARKREEFSEREATFLRIAGLGGGR